MRVLLITYYWPPAGGSGVQRWFYFCKYLAKMGVEVTVYTPENPEYAITDESLLEEEIPGIKVLKNPIFEPNQILSVFKKDKKQDSAGFLNPNPTFFEKKLQSIRANHFIPDARKFWIRPSVKFLEKYLKYNPTDLIITNGPPHSLHLIGYKLHQLIKVKWIADFRDPWLEIDYFHQLPLSEKSREIHKDLEKKVAENADGLIVVGKSMQDYFLKFNKNTQVITNGFESLVTPDKIELDQKFSFIHVGLMNADRNPITLWKVLSKICNNDSDFKNDLKIELIGKVDALVIEAIEKNNLKSNTELVDYLPHKEVLKHQSSAQVLLLPINRVPFAKGIITGKIFEYLLARRPILAIAPKEGDLAEIIIKTNAGIVVDFEDEIGLEKAIFKFYKEYKKNDLQVHSKNIDQYSRENLINELYDFMESVLTN